MSNAHSCRDEAEILTDQVIQAAGRKDPAGRIVIRNVIERALIKAENRGREEIRSK